MTSIISNLPKPGTILTYKDALLAYDVFEKSLMSRVYAQSFFPNVKAYDLAWQINCIACKFGVEDKRPFAELKDVIHRFTLERTALANGKNGERFYLQKNAQALARYDETHMFEIGINGKEISDKLEKCINLLSMEAETTDEYADTFSSKHPDRIVRLSIQRESDDRFFRITMRILAASLVVVVLCMLLHTLFGIGSYGKWLL